MKTLRAVVLSAAMMALGGAVAPLHEVTYLGTVMTVEAAGVQVMVMDEKTKKETHMAFGVTEATKVYRGEQLVTFAEAHIQMHERIAVTINREASGDDALVIKLAAHG